MASACARRVCFPSCPIARITSSILFRKRASMAGSDTNRAGAGLAAPARSMPWSISEAMLGIMTIGLRIWAARAGLMKTYCPISNAQKAMCAGAASSTAARGHWASPISSGPTPLPKPLSKAPADFSSPSPMISMMENKQGSESIKSPSAMANVAQPRALMSNHCGASPISISAQAQRFSALLSRKAASPALPWGARAK